ncbi:MAG: hypothetical protein PHI12_08580 [Dehalococcoidales bacterium]|nr:hypothetical protein [Dehalococcoidales bacterium]
MADRQDYTAIAATGAAVMAALAWSKSPAAASSQFPPELMQLLTAMASDLNDADRVKLADILVAIQQLNPELNPAVGGLKGYPANLPRLSTTRVQILAVNTAVQLPDIVIPDGFAVKIKAYPTNAGIVRVGPGKTGAIDPNQAETLLANEATFYNIQNTNILYVTSTALAVVGEYVTVTAEQS